MATIASQSLPAVTPTSVQPGGGFCMNLELAWGRFRRAWLRRLRPAYVQDMANKRQGACPNCPHDIVDPRDLKFWRNVCGYWFRPEDDPFRWRDRIGLARMGLAEVVCFSLLFSALSLLGVALALIVHWGAWLLLALTLGPWGFVVSFFRDPQRTIPTDPLALLSPADGTVTHVGEVDDPDFPNGRAFRISIFLSVFNVHVNRMPRAGRVTAVRYIPGEFLDARHPECGVRNEQMWIDVEEPNGRPLRLKQISGAIARRIVCWLKAGDAITAGERFGMIKFGSRTDVLLPIDAVNQVQVKIGDTVHGGTTILLRLRP